MREWYECVGQRTTHWKIRFEKVRVVEEGWPGVGSGHDIALVLFLFRVTIHNTMA
jgi:hypothetical protein